MSTCQIWDFDDLTSCSRIKYLNEDIPLYLLLGLLAYVCYNIYSTRNGASSIKLPMIPEDKEFTLNENGRHHTAGLEIHHPVQYFEDFADNISDKEEYTITSTNGLQVSNKDGHHKIQPSIHMHNQIKADHYDLDTRLPSWTGIRSFEPLIIVRQRKRLDVINIIIEFSFVFSQVVYHCYWLDNISSFKDDSKTELTFFSMFIKLLLWIFLAITVFFRLINTNQAFSFISSRLGNLWNVSFTSYFIVFMSHILPYRSTLINSEISKLDTKYYSHQFYVNLILFFQLFTSPVKNQFPILYRNLPDSISSPEPISSLISLISFTWLSPLILMSIRSTLDSNEVWDLIKDDYSLNVIKHFQRFKINHFKDKSFSFQFLTFFWKLISIQIIWAVFSSIFSFIPTILLKKILEFVENPEPERYQIAWLYVSSMLLSKVIVAICQGQIAFVGRRISIRMRSIIISAIYEKGLKKSILDNLSNDESECFRFVDEPNTAEKFSDGGIINLMATDAIKVGELCNYLHSSIEALIMAVVAVILLYRILGTAAFIGTAVIIFFIPFNVFLTKLIARFQRETLTFTDQRIQNLNETFQSIRIIKSFGWENNIIQKILGLRNKEISVLKRNSITWSINALVWYLSPTIITTLSFSYYILVDKQDLTTPVAFTALALFNLLKAPLDQLSNTINFLTQSKVSLDRIEKFLSVKETTKFENLSVDSSQNRLAFSGATLGWCGNKKSFQLRNINAEFEMGKLNLVIGPTGSGKTSLLMALLGELHLFSGKVFVPNLESKFNLIPESDNLLNSIAYCSQLPWIFNDTIRNNIIFDMGYDKDRYENVVIACGLERDFQILNLGDKTIVGDKGSCLSGGQKQRISLARALYSKSRHLILDDCLSAVDSHSAKWIYNVCITGPLMQGRTCILVSHNVSLTIKKASKVFMIENGYIVASGRPIDLIKQGYFPDITNFDTIATDVEDLNTIFRSNKLEDSSDLKSRISGDNFGETSSDNLDTKVADDIFARELCEDNSKKTSINIEFIEDIEEGLENNVSGAVNSEVYKWYFDLYGGHKMIIFICGLLLLAHAIYVSQSWWLRYWSNDNSLDVNGGTIGNESSLYYLRIYFLIGVTHSIISSTRGIFSFFAGVNTANLIFKKLLYRVVNSKLTFFDNTPIGRIMNRFSKDIQVLDSELAPFLDGVFSCFIQAVTALMLIVFITPKFLIIAIFIICSSITIGYLYLCCSRELKRFESSSKSPVYQHFTETLSGLVTIRAFGNEIKFLKENLDFIDENNKFFFYMWSVNSWLSFRIDLLGAITVFGSGAFILLNADKIDAGLAGISLTYAVTFTEFCLWMVKFYSTVEMSMNSVERLKEYMEIEEEALADPGAITPSENWPVQGAITFANYSLRYAPKLPDVLKQLNLKIDGGSKIGVVGRTGAGKSTIISALFRFLDCSSGKILIDDLDISEINLRRLRSCLTIIPQDPSLFVGTIRSNLDPNEEYENKDIYDALVKVHLLTEDYLANLNYDANADVAYDENIFLNLDSPISEGGINLSQGQRQLICLARSILHCSKIVLLDEATASIDYKSDFKVQETIRNEFSQKTILTIAHRIKSVIDYDKILVLDAGQALEFDHPYVLLQNKSSIFYSMCMQSGELDILLKLAREAYEKS
ncbi:hypothetical protein TPHA_0K02310 [Tetrapisispora phaffii CBS 4417]|uniref:Uncharacterized protein n=1 Tax=Tetrapisispora phaffii (strain ATCC 24235 / CBS 4417 / NBRC 1672 / NRRL Y-8282 / UCD 70-5) TaxID=1071381 RepID=G8BZN3_TETPH|nr:hypothetical protein TPHA_0K02310 [Tetrapisispora phaffii CBS 4417]CCE65361.1 hypothetical protein TPHA_0K02310 [Tetrapisispora phaffii CBS 4417]